MSDTPETDRAARRAIVGDATRYVVSREFAEGLERQRAAYAETLRVIASTNERSHHEAAFAALIRDRHPELANTDGDGRRETTLSAPPCLPF